MITNNKDNFTNFCTLVKYYDVYYNGFLFFNSMIYCLYEVIPGLLFCGFSTNKTVCHRIV